MGIFNELKEDNGVLVAHIGKVAVALPGEMKEVLNSSGSAHKRTSYRYSPEALPCPSGQIGSAHLIRF